MAGGTTLKMWTVWVRIPSSTPLSQKWLYIIGRVGSNPTLGTKELTMYKWKRREEKRINKVKK